MVDKNLSHANRKFYEIPSQVSEKDDKIVSELKNDHDHGEGGILTLIREGVIGKDKTFSGPYGIRKGKTDQGI